MSEEASTAQRTRWGPQQFFGNLLGSVRMAQIRTHYDNLKVARNAPPEVIRAAYKALSQKFHPDRNSDNAEAARIMVMINTSYEILSDPGKRRKHDLWINQQERAAAQEAKPNRQSQQTSRQTKTAQPSPPKATFGGLFAHVLRNWAPYGVAVVIILGLVSHNSGTPPPEQKPNLLDVNVRRLVANNSGTPPPGQKPYQANPAPVRSEYVRPTTAPNGHLWPLSAGYIAGFQQLHADGLSTVTVDNSRNNSDVFVKLVSLDSVRAYPVRQIYIPAFGSFTLNKVTTGSYDIRYRDLSNGGLSRSEPFNLKELPTYNGTQFSNITITLYKVQNGNMQTYDLSEADF